MATNPQQQIPDPFFGRLPEVVIRVHLIPFMDQPKDLASLMAASPTICDAVTSYSSTNAWMNSDLVNSKVYRKHFRFLGRAPNPDDLREICPAWRTVTDNYFDMVYKMELDYDKERRPFLRPGSRAPFFDTPNQTRLWKYMHYMQSLNNRESKCTSVQKINEYLAKGRDQAGHNLFPNRSVNLKNCFREPMESSCAKLLTTYGKEIRKLDIFCRVSDKHEDSQVLDTKNLGQLIEKVSSLSELILSLDWGYKGGRQLDLVADPTPLPELSGLRSLSFYLHLETYDFFNVYWDQLTTLEAPSKNFMCWYDPQRHSTFPNLQRLTLGLRTREDVAKLRSFRSPLKEIFFQCPIGTSLLACFYAVEGFAQTLCSVFFFPYIEFENKNGTDFILKSEELAASRLQFPSIRLLRISSGHYRITSKNLRDLNIDAVLGLANTLGYLHIGTSPGYGKPELDEGRVLKFWGNIESLYESNIWELMPALMEIKVKITKEEPPFRRTVWEEMNGRTKLGNKN